MAVPSMGYAEGGATGIIPGPANPDGGDNTMTPTKTGEYILPVEAIIAKGRELAPHSQLSDEDAHAIGKIWYDQETSRLKSEMGNNTPPRNAGELPQGVGHAEGGVVNWLDQHVVNPINNLAAKGLQAVGIQTTPPSPTPQMLGPQGLPTRDAADAGVGHNQAVYDVAKQTGYDAGGMVDNETPGINPAKPNIPQTVDRVPRDLDITSAVNANKTRDTAIKQAMGGTGSLDPSILPAAFQPNLQPATAGVGATGGVGIGGKVTMTPTTDKLSTDKEGYLKQPQGVSPGTGIISSGGKTFDVAGMGATGVGINSNFKSTAVKDLTTSDGRPLSRDAQGRLYTLDENNQPIQYVGETKNKKMNMQEVFMAGERDNLKKQGITDEGEINRRLNKSWQDQQEHLAAARGASYKDNQQYQAYDSQNDNKPVYVTGKQLKDNPDRYMPTATTAKALGQTALIEDIRGTVGDTRAAIKNLKTEFTPEARAQMALVFKSRDPSSAWSQFWGGSWAKGLTPDQQDYLVKVQLLHENAMAMRSVLGAGQGSEDLRNAISATIPGASTPSKEFATKQLDSFEKVLNRLERGVPKVGLRKDTGATDASASGVGITPDGQAAQSSEKVTQAAHRIKRDLGNGYTEDQIIAALKTAGMKDDEIKAAIKLHLGV